MISQYTKQFTLLIVASISLNALSVNAADDFQNKLNEVRKYKVGDNYAPLSAVAELVTDAKTKEAKQKLAKPLAAMLSQDVTNDAKKFALRQLYLIGDAPQVSAIEPLLTNPELSHMARYALERMPAEEATAALRNALSKAPDNLLPGVINSVGNRGDVRATQKLIELSQKGDSEISRAAISALGEIATPEASEVVIKHIGKGSPAFQRTVYDAVLSIADRNITQKQTDKAGDIYKRLYSTEHPHHVRIAALDGMLKLESDARKVSMLTDLLKGDDSRMKAVAARRLVSIPGRELTLAITAMLNNADNESQTLLLNTLSERGDRSASPAIQKLAIQTKDEAVKTAAIQALIHTGQTDAVSTLAMIASQNTGQLRNTARNALTKINAPNTNQAIIQAVGNAETATQSELIRALGERGAQSATSQLIELAANLKLEEKPRREAIRVLADLAEPVHLKKLLGLLKSAETPSLLQTTTRTVTQVIDKHDNPQSLVGEILASADGTTNGARAAIIQILSEIGGTQALNFVRRNMKSNSPVVSNAANRAIFDWPNEEAADDAIEVIKTTQNQTYRILAMRGLVRMSNTSTQSAGKRIALLKKAIEVAESVDDKKLILSGLAEIPHKDAIDVIRPFRDDPKLAQEAKLAQDKVTKMITGPPTMTASHGQNKINNAADGNTSTRWDTGKPQEPGMWFQIDLKSEKTLSSISLDSRQSANDYPRGYELYVSNNPNNFGKPLVTGKGDGPVTTINFKPTNGRFIKVVQTGSSEGNFWSIHELTIK